jgi:hypothetical protein
VVSEWYQKVVNCTWLVPSEITSAPRALPALSSTWSVSERPRRPAIVGLLARARASRRSLLACNLSEHYVEIFNVTRLSDFISVLPDEKSAIAKASVS